MKIYLLLLTIMISNLCNANSYILRISMIYKNEIGRGCDMHFLINDIEELNEIKILDIKKLNEENIYSLFKTPINPTIFEQDYTQKTKKLLDINVLFKKRKFVKKINNKDYVIEFQLINANFSYYYFTLEHSIWHCGNSKITKACQIDDFKEKLKIKNKFKNKFKKIINILKNKFK